MGKTSCLSMFFLFFLSLRELLFSFSNEFFSYCLAFCGDGFINGTEKCDDKISVHPTATCAGGGTGCNDFCQIETGYECNYNFALSKSVCARMFYFLSTRERKKYLSNIN